MTVDPNLPENPETAPIPDGMTTKEKQDRFSGIFKGGNQWIPFVLVGALVAAIFGGWYLMQHSGKHPTETATPVATSSTTEVVQPTATATKTENQPGKETTTTAPPNSHPTQAATDQASQQSDDGDKVKQAVDQFVKSVKSGKKGQAWADELKPIVSTGFYESLKYSDSASIPEGAKNVTVRGGNGIWDVTVKNDANKVLYTFKMVGYRNAQGGTSLLVDSLTIPETGEPTYDDRGRVVPVTNAPVSDAIYQTMYVQSTRVLKTYFEVKPGDTKDSREIAVKKVINGGEAPALRDASLGENRTLSMSDPTEAHIMNAVTMEPTKDGYITVSMKTAYTDAADPGAPVEMLIMGIDFKWDVTTKAWQVAGLRVIGKG